MGSPIQSNCLIYFAYSIKNHACNEFSHTSLNNEEISRFRNRYIRCTLRRPEYFEGKMGEGVFDP